MRPDGPMRVEHRVIERMIDIMRAKVADARKNGRIDPLFIDTAVDFIRTYADRTHHGKEEDIYFRVLGTKDLSSDDQRVMNELVEEHKRARKMVRDLVDAKGRYVAGDGSALEVILGKLEALAAFYPEHIRKEDDVFFPASLKYLDRAELDAMLAEFWEFDRKMIHEKYRAVVEQLEK
ncbi:MAG: hemerythrin domain-containing protein [Kiritimatiellae bacterium]|nr:hemerythrin domain-containing protein [Kiritimatiellia bacterium]